MLMTFTISLMFDSNLGGLCHLIKRESFGGNFAPKSATNMLEICFGKYRH